MISTNSIVQDYSRPVVEKHIDAGKNPLKLVFAVTNHPWVENKDGAAVDVAMVAATPNSENAKPVILEVNRRGRAYEIEAHAVQRINASLRNIPNVFAAKALKANLKMCFQGVVPAGDGFKLDQPPGNVSEQRAIKPYMIGDDLTERMQSGFIVDFFGMSVSQAEAENAWAFSKVLTGVKPERDQNSRSAYRDRWWLFAEPRPALRRATADLVRYIATPYTARHRPFVFLQATIVPDAMIYVIASDDAYLLGCLSSSVHTTWCKYAGGTLQDRPRYNSDRTFLPFPFPDTFDEALKARIRDSAERLDGLRKDVLARHADLTLTKLYNALEALRAAEAAGTVLGDDDRDVAERGCVSLIRQYHDEIDIAVAEAYGWPADLPDEAILERLVALNIERAAEEATGKVRWLRSEFQAPGYVSPAEQAALALPEAEKPGAEILEWPGALPEQVVVVAGVVARAARPLGAGEVARAFRGKRAATVAPVLDALAGMGRVRKLDDGRYAA